MTDFHSPAEFRADLQRQFDAFAPLLRGHHDAIASLEREREMVALQIATIDRVMAMQPPVITGEIEMPPTQPGPITFVPRREPPTTTGLTIAQLAGDEPITVPAAPRQRADVRGPVLAYLRSVEDVELTASDIARALPALKLPSIVATLQAAAKAGDIETDGHGLYWAGTKDTSSGGGTLDAALAAATPTAAANPDDRQGEDGGRHPAHPSVDTAYGGKLILTPDGFCAQPDQPIAEEDRRVPRHTIEPELDPRALDGSDEGQVRALKAALVRAGPAGLPEENAFIAPHVIMQGIEAGWLDRTEDDRGPRLWLTKDLEEAP